MKKYIFVLLNILAAILAVATLLLININFPDGNIISIVNAPAYEKTEDFYTSVNNSLTDMFKYINYSRAFENNGEVNYNKIIAESKDNYGAMNNWTLNDCLDYADEHGLYIDTDYNAKYSTSKSYPPFDINRALVFMFKTYPSNKRTGASTEEEFITEVMNALATYNRCKIYFNTESNFKYSITYTDRLDASEIVYKNCNYDSSDFLNTDAFIYISSKENIISSNIDYVSSSLIKTFEAISPHPDKDYVLYTCIDTNYSANDSFKKAYDVYNSVKEKCGTLIALSIISVIIFLATLFAALYFILSSERKIDEAKKFFFALPTELHILFYIIFNIIFIQIYNIALSANFLPREFQSFRVYFYTLIVYITSISFFTILSSKYVNDSLTPSLIKLNRDIPNDEFKVSPLIAFALVFLPIIIFIILSFYLIYLHTIIGNRLLLIVGIVLLISTIGFIAYLFTIYNSFNKALKAKEDANNMRSSLIANVTHDIKTPLTSILNYAELITSEVQNPSKSYKKNIIHYSQIVNDKTNRLNELINDLIFDSKVSTGNVNLELQKIDLVSFLTQVNTEFKDKLLSKGIKIVFTHDVKNAYINADSNHLYRVFQNLFSNIYKYALDKSRVYIDLITTKNKVKIMIKNIQKEQLQVPVDSLKERFVRGNVSRTTEGFGLGLSISENLIKSMGGKLDIKNVRDEFITNITFMLYED